jgi:hypothetical protein
MLYNGISKIVNARRTMENKRKPVFWIFIKSFTDMHAYKHFVYKNFSKAFLYILLFTFLLSVIFSAIFVASIKDYTTQLITQLEQNTPEFTIKNGELVIESDQPVILAETDDKGTLIIIDKEYTGSVTKYEEYDTVIVLGQKEIYLSNSAIRYSIGYQSVLGQKQEVTSEMLFGRVSSSKPYLYIFFFVSMFVFFIGNYLFYDLFIALIVNTIRRIRKRPANLGISLQLTAYALTLPAIIYLIWIFTSLITIPIEPLIFILAVIIAYKGVDAYYKSIDEELTKPKEEA